MDWESPQNRKLRNAIKGGNDKEAKRLIKEEGADPSAILGFGVYYDAPELVKASLDLGADPNKAVFRLRGETRLEAIKTFLEHPRSKGVNLDRKGHQGWSPIHQCARDGSVGAMELLLKHGAAVDPENDGGDTPLIVATRLGRHETVKALIGKGANVNHMNNQGETPLHISLEAAGHCDEEFVGNDLKIAEHLLDAGADPHISDKEGRTAWQMMEGSKHADKFGPIFYLHWKGPTEEQRAFFNAVREGNVVKVRKLTNERTTNARDNMGMTSLGIALRTSQPRYADVAKVLLEHGIDPNMVVRTEELPLHVAAGHGSPEAVKVLLEHGADIEGEGQDGCRPLHRAAYRGKKRQ